MIVKGFCFVCFDTTVPSSDLQHGGNALNRSWSPTRGRQHIVENLEGIKKKKQTTRQNRDVTKDCPAALTRTDRESAQGRNKTTD